VALGVGERSKTHKYELNIKTHPQKYLLEYRRPGMRKTGSLILPNP
jgi:hypothetical protein